MKKSLWMIYQDYLENNPIWNQDFETFKKNYKGKLNKDEV